MSALNVMKKRIVEGCEGRSGGWFHWGKKWNVSGMDPFLKCRPYWKGDTMPLKQCTQKTLENANRNLCYYIWKYMQQAISPRPQTPQWLHGILTMITVSWLTGISCDRSWRDLSEPTSETNTLKRRRNPGENRDNISLRSKVHKQKCGGIEVCPLAP